MLCEYSNNIDKGIMGIFKSKKKKKFVFFCICYLLYLKLYLWLEGGVYVFDFFNMIDSLCYK